MSPAENTEKHTPKEQVCRFLDMSIYDLARMSKIGVDNNMTQLSVEQERDRPGLQREIS